MRKRGAPGGSEHISEDLPRTFNDAGDLRIIMIAAAFRTSPACRSNAPSSSLIRQVSPDLLDALFDIGEKHCLFILHEAFQMSRGAFGEEKALAGRDLEALMGELILIGVGKKA